jgi:hypothetical protein
LVKLRCRAGEGHALLDDLLPAEAPIYVDESDDGPRIRAAASAHRVTYRTVAR